MLWIYYTYVIRMPFKKLPVGEKRKRIYLTLAPETMKGLKIISDSRDLPVSRVVDMLVVEYSDRLFSNVPGIQVEEIVEESKPVENVVVKCPKCGDSVPEKTPYCINCGQPLYKSKNVSSIDEAMEKLRAENRRIDKLLGR